MTAIIDDVQQGNVEELIRRIRQQYYRSSIATRFSIRDRLSNMRLEDYADVEHYFAAIKNTISTLVGLGEIVSEEGKVYALLKGLPSPDYESVKVQALAPRATPYTLNEVFTLIRDLADRSNNIPGTKHKNNNRISAFNTTTSEVCRDFLKGKCRRGKQCRYKHVQQPHQRACKYCDKTNHKSRDCTKAPTCTYCDKRGHTHAECFKRKREQTQQAMTASVSSTMNSNEQNLMRPTPNTSHTTSDVSTASDTFPHDLAIHECHALSSTRPKGPFHCPICGRGRCPCNCSREQKEPTRPLGGRPPSPTTYVISEEAFNASPPSRKRDNPLFLLDSGATVAIVTDPDLCTETRPINAVVMVGGKREIPVTTAGILTIWIGRGNTRRTHTLTKVLVCPEFGKNIMPECVWHIFGGHIHKHENKMQIFDKNRKLILSATLAANSTLFYFRPVVCTRLTADMPLPRALRATRSTPASRVAATSSTSNVASPKNAMSANSKVAHDFSSVPRASEIASASRAMPSSDSNDTSTSSHTDQHGTDEDTTTQCYSCYIARSYSDGLSDLMLWHHRLGHKSFRAVARLLGLRLPAKSIFCRSCVDGKLDRYPLNRSTKQVATTPNSPRPGYLLFADAAGPFRVPTRAGKRYLYIFVDDYSRMVFPYLVKSLSEFYDIFVALCARLEAQFGREKVVAQLLGDSHRVHFSNALEIFCARKGIQLLYTAPYTPALNPAERYVGIVIEMTRVMLLHASTPPSLAGEAIHYSCFIIIRLPVNFSDGPAAPLERWHDRRMPDAIKHTKVWGCAAWPKALPVARLGKFEPRARPTHLFVGMDTNNRSYRLLTVPGFRLVFSAHCVFHENVFPLRAHAHAHTPTSALSHLPPGHVDFAPPTHQPLPPTSAAAGRPRRPPMPSEAFLRALPDTDVPPDHREDVATAVDDMASVHAVDADQYTPTTHDDAMRLPEPERKAWRDAERSEYRSHVKFGTLGPRVDRCPPGYTPIPTALIYKIKRDGRYKARLVIRGYRMRSSVDLMKRSHRSLGLRQYACGSLLPSSATTTSCKPTRTPHSSALPWTPRSTCPSRPVSAMTLPPR